LMLEDLVLLIFFIAGCLVFAHFIGNSPITKVIETKVTGKRVRFQQSITASGNTYVPIKNEVFTIDTVITFDIPVSKSLWDKLERNDSILINKHLNGEYSFKKRLTG
jgi:hypothetical protein